MEICTEPSGNGPPELELAEIAEPEGAIEFGKVLDTDAYSEFTNVRLIVNFAS